LTTLSSVEKVNLLKIFEKNENKQDKDVVLKNFNENSAT